MLNLSQHPPTSHPPIESVHKALEDELYPDKRLVHVVTGEERFGLRSVPRHGLRSLLHRHSLAWCSS